MTFLDFPRYSGYSIHVRWANVQAIDVNFFSEFNTPKIIKIG